MASNRNLLDPEVERRVLSAVLEGSIERQRVARDLFPSVPGPIVDAVLAIAGEGPIDGGGLALLADRLVESELVQIGGLPGLSVFFNDTVPVITAEQQDRLLARLVDLRDRRVVFAGVSKMARGAVDAAVPIERLRAAALGLAVALPEGGNGRKTSYTLAELAAAKVDPPAFIVQDLLPVGLTILSGRPKSGKSFLALQLSMAVAGGGLFLDRPAREGPVLYLALEDSPSRFWRRIAGWGIPPHLPVQVEFAWPSLAGDGLPALLQRVDQLAPALCIVDTLSRAFAGGGRRLDWNDQGNVTDVLAPLQSAALERGLAVVAVDHHRKGKGLAADPIDDLLGSSAKSGILDTAWGLYRERLTGKATLALTGRDVEESELALLWDGLTSSWQARGDAREIAAEEADGEVLDALRTLGGQADAGAVGRELGKARVTARRTLERLTARGTLQRRVSGDRGQVLYSIPGSEPATPRTGEQVLVDV